MKKIVSILLSLVSVICLAFAFTGCEDKHLTEGNNQSTGEGQPTEENKKPIEARGKFYTLKVAYDNGWLNEGDLKSIACDYYDFYKYEENPYSGLFDTHEELSEESEKEIKQAYLEQIVEYPDGLLENIHISRYYGTYNGNIAVSIYSGYICIDISSVPPETDIGGVIFKSFWQGDIRVYHIN